MPLLEMFGSEDECVVMLDVIDTPECLSRGRNLLVAVTTTDKW